MFKKEIRIAFFPFHAIMPSSRNIRNNILDISHELIVIYYFESFLSTSQEGRENIF